MKASILATTEKQTFNGLQLGFVLDSKNEQGDNEVYYPFFQNIVQPEAIGKYLMANTGNGNKSELISE